MHADILHAGVCMRWLHGGVLFVRACMHALRQAMDEFADSMAGWV